MEPELQQIQELRQLTKLNLTENQIKVIRDKYLKNSPTIEHWLKNVCHNIALADILHLNAVSEDEIFAGVNYKKIEYPSRNKIAKTYLLHHGLLGNDDRQKNFKRFLENLEEINIQSPEIIEKTEEKFYELLSTFKFLPNSPTLMNAGRDLQQLSACFKEDQPIMTMEGIKPIIDIKKGDYVLTASGNFKRVTKIMERSVESYRIINVWKLPNQTLSVSDEHPILCLDQESNKPKWKFASQIKDDDYIAVSYPKKIKDIEKINVIDYLNDKNFSIKSGKIFKLNRDRRSPKYNLQIKSVINEIKVDYELMKIFGYYMSEGDIDNDSVRFTFNSDEIGYMNDLIGLVERKFGITSKIEKSNLGNWSNVKFHSKILSEFMSKIIGKGFNKKNIPSWILNLPVKKQKGLLVGILRGDGYGFTNRHTTNIRAVLSNKNLVYGIWVIFARMGMLASFKELKMSMLATVPQYKCSLDSFNSEKIFYEVFTNKEFAGISQIAMKRTKEKLVNGIFYLPVKDISIFLEPIKVYNFEVEEEHTYVANNIAVHNCYVLPVEDSIDGIYSSVKNMALIHQSGGGTGFSFSRLRPSGDVVKTTKGISSGPISFMQIFDKSTEVVKQGGTRRGANMGILHYTHPNILDFIEMKKTHGFMENFNVSATIDEKFMNAVKNNEDYDLINPRNKQITGKLNAREVWKKLIKGAWETGDPGIVIIDRINNTGSNATPHLGMIESTNPCVAEGTLVNTPTGYIRIEDIKIGDKISTSLGHEPVKSIEKHENVPVFRVKFSDGGEQTVSAAHRYYAIKKGSQSKKIIDYRLDELEIGDYIRVEPTPVLNSNPSDYFTGLKTGILLGDGCYTEDAMSKNIVKIASNTEDFEFNQNVKKLFGEDNFRKDDFSANSKSMSIILKDGRQVVQELQLTPSYSYQKTFDITKINTREMVLGIVDGLLATDGDILLKSNHPQIRFVTSSESLVQNIRRLLLMLGCHGRIFESFFDDGGKIGERKIIRKHKKYQVIVSGESAGKLSRFSKIEKLSPIKGKKLKELRKEWMTTGNTWKSKINSIEPIGNSCVYDLYCEESDTWITDGYVQRGCGEQPLLPYEPCNLGSINLSKFIKEDRSDFDYEKLRECVFACTHFLDNVIDINNYPIPEIEETAKKTRRIGLGIMGWAESLVMLKIPYNSNRALKKAEEVMKFINVSCLNASEELAEKRGIFPAWKGSIYDRTSVYFRGQEFFPRHSARTTIAPTGTIGLAAGLQGAGIEPFFAIVYVRYNAAGIDALKKNEKPLEKDSFFEVNPLFDKIAKENNYFGLTKEKLYLKINDNHKSLVGLKEIPIEIQNLFLTSHDLNPKEHVMMQCAFQKHIDNAVSKTVNMRNEATEKDVEEVYLLAYENGAKGVTVYRDGSKQFQVLNINEKEKGKQKVEEKERRKKDRTQELSDYYLIETGHGPIHLHINYDEEGPTKIFANISPSGTEISGLANALAIALSKYLELGGDPTRILKHLNSVKSEKPFGFGKNRIDSIPHAISVALRNHLIKTGKMKPLDSENLNINQRIIVDSTIKNNKNEEFDLKLHCPKCFSANVGMVSGCDEPTCFDCGYSKCS